MNFSVLLSVYIKENPQYLSQALDSIINQSVQASEIIIVKDGPLTKELDEIINQYNKNYQFIRIVALPNNLGLGKALNEGIKHCHYELIARMDTDDISKPNRFEKQLEIFKLHPETDICSVWLEEFEGDFNNILFVKKLPEKHNEIMQYAHYRCPINHAVAMYKKSAVLAVGGYSGFPEDYNLWIKMLMNGAHFYNIQESLYLCRFSKDMIKRRGGWKYAIADIKSQFSFYKMGFLSLATLLYNIIIRITVRLIPNFLRTFIYKKYLRK